MKLLFDENLSPRLPGLLEEVFPGSRHVRECGLRGCPDEDVWRYAGEHGFILVSKDSDFQQRSLLFGHPPKVVWLRIGNCDRNRILHLLTVNRQTILDMHGNPQISLIAIS
jgi:predicted nuclease of predicted toxin-antitoxin system